MRIREQDLAVDTRVEPVHAAVEIDLASAREKIANLEIALTTRTRIGIAMGILMARRQLTESAAFELLRAASQQQHVKIRALADRVIETGTLDTEPSADRPRCMDV